MLARAFSEGDVLAFDSRVTRGGVEGSNQVRYTMAPDGRSVVAEERFRSAVLNYDNRWWMDRAPDR